MAIMRYDLDSEIRCRLLATPIRPLNTTILPHMISAYCILLFLHNIDYLLNTENKHIQYILMFSNTSRYM